MPKRVGTTMNVLRWIFGIPLAFLLAFGILYILVTVDSGPAVGGFSFSLAVRVFEVIIVFSLPVFLSCLFTPSPKKYAALISVSIITLFTVAALIYRFIINPPYHSTIQTASVLGSYMILIAGSSAGFGVSYAVFKNRGWERKPKDLDIEEFD